MTIDDLSSEELVHARRVLLYWQAAPEASRLRSRPLMWRDVLGMFHAQVVLDPAPASVLAQKTLTNLADLHRAGDI